MPRKPYRRFATLELEVIWRAIELLDIALKHALLAALTQELFVEPHLRANGPSAREERAVLALHEAKEIVGHSPSMGEFVALREQHPEYRWPHPSRVRAWLGSGSWNAALKRAGLEACAADVIIRERVGSGFPADELIGFLRLAALELGNSFTFEQYSHWARRPDVAVAHGLVARSLNPFIRAFGSWSEAFEAAGLREEHVVVGKQGVPRSARHVYPRAKLMKALQLAAETLGHAPMVVEYKLFRAQLWQEQRKLLPSAWAIRRPFADDWRAACAAAGLEDPGETATAEFHDDELLEFVARAVGAGHKTRVGYDAWRVELLAAAKSNGERLRVPSSTTIRKRFGGWEIATTLATGRMESGPRSRRGKE